MRLDPAVVGMENLPIHCLAFAGSFEAGLSGSLVVPRRERLGQDQIEVRTQSHVHHCAESVQMKVEQQN